MNTRGEFELKTVDHNEEERLEDKCFLIKTRGYRDEMMDFCELTDRVCTLATESTCGEWERIKEDERKEIKKGVGA